MAMTRTACIVLEEWRREMKTRSGWIIAALFAAILVGPGNAQAGGFRNWVRTAIADLDSRVRNLEAAVIELTEFVLAQGQPAGTGLFVVDATGQTLGPAYPQVDYVRQSNGSVRVETFTRVVMDVENVGMVACDVRGNEGEILRPRNIDTENQINWTGPACTGTPFSPGRIPFMPAMLPSILSIASVPSGTYVLGEPLPDLTPLSAEGGSGCQEMEAPHVPMRALQVIRVAPFIGEMHLSPYHLELR